MRSQDLHCATCQAERRFEAPPCPDGHGDDCAELVCTTCGCALIVAPAGALDDQPSRVPTLRGRAA